MAYSVETILTRYGGAKTRRDQWNALLEECYDYVMPNRRPNKTTEGQKNTNKIYDATAVIALRERRARLHSALFPPYRDWVKLELDTSKLNLSPEDRKQVDAYLAEATRKFHRAIMASNFHTEVPLALGDALISTGCLAVHQGDPEMPLRFEALPVDQYIPEEGAWGNLASIYRVWEIEVRHIIERWPDAKLGPELEKLLKDKPDTKVKLIEACLWNAEEKRHDYCLIDDADKSKLLERNYDKSPLVAFRMDRATGEVMGRGPVLDVLPDIKTLNKLVELVLKNASIAVTGIWQADDDGVLNPANIRLVPGAIIPKAIGSNGLTPLQSPGRFDVSQLERAKLIEIVLRAILGPALPPDDGMGVRSALEVSKRSAERDAVELPISLRLQQELDEPLTLRVLTILSSPSMIESPFYIGPLTILDTKLTPRPASPLVRLQDISDAMSHQDSVANMNALFPQQLATVLDLEAFVSNQLKSWGVPDEFIRSPEAMEIKVARLTRELVALGPNAAQVIATASDALVEAGALPDPAEVMRQTQAQGAN